jgi:hypothetical protein
MMVRTARQRRVLRAMEKELAACEPHLAAMFALFGRLARDEERADKERLPGRRWSSGLRLSVPLVAMAVLIGVLVVLPAPAYSACGAGGRTRGVREAAAVSCRAPAPRGPARVTADNPDTAAEPTFFLSKLANANAGTCQRASDEGRQFGRTDAWFLWPRRRSLVQRC